MEPRIDTRKIAPQAIQSMLGIEKYLNEAGLEPSLRLLIQLRASQINGCAYCLDMHWKDAKALGESDQRLYMLDAWRESDFYTERERAALAWTEAVTNISSSHAPDEVFEDVRKQFSEKEIADLTLAIATINSWNRLNIALRTVPGTYQPGKLHQELKKTA